MSVSWAVLRETPAMLGVAAAGLVGHAAVSLSLLYLLLGRWPTFDDLTFPHSLVVLPLIGAGAYVSTFCNAVLVATAHARIEGRPISVRAGVTAAALHLPQLIAWTTLSIVVGTALQVVAERLGVAGRLANWLLGMAWSLATVFIVPVLVIEGASVRRGVPRSARLFRERWGETVTADIGTGLVVILAVVAAVPVVLLVALVAAPLAIALGVAVLAAGLTVQNTFAAVLTAALYGYARDGRTLGGFTEADLAGTFLPRA